MTLNQFVDLPDEEKRPILEKAGQMTNEAQRKIMTNLTVEALIEMVENSMQQSGGVVSNDAGKVLSDNRVYWIDPQLLLTSLREYKEGEKSV